MFEKFQLFKNQYLILIDGTQYFTSENISCPGCLKKTSQKTGQTTYFHGFLGASIVHPDQRQVILLAPEPIQNTDGSSKQDCERNAGKRLIQKIRKTQPKLNIIITGGGLYSNQPFIDELKTNRMLFFWLPSQVITNSYLVSERKPSFSSISVSGSNFNPQNTTRMPAVKIFAFLDLDKKSWFSFGHYLTTWQP